MSLATCLNCHGRFDENMGTTCPYCGETWNTVEDSLSIDHEEFKNDDDTDGMADDNDVSSDQSSLQEFLSAQEAVAQQEIAQQEDQPPESRSVVSLLFSPFGRIGRRDYLFGFLLLYCALAISLLFEHLSSVTGLRQFSPVLTACLVAALVSLWMIALKRVHDLDHSGGFLLGMSVWLGFLPLLYFAVAGGSRGKNSYGRQTNIEWNIASCLISMILALGGAYSTLIIVLLANVEESYQKAFAEYSGGRNEEAQGALQAVFEDAELGQSLCPICSDFRHYQMWTAWCCGDTHAQQSQWDPAEEWLKKSQGIAETLTGSPRYPDIEANLYQIRVQLIQVLEGAGKSAEAIALLETMNTQDSASPQVSGRSPDLKSTEALLRLKRKEYDKALKLYTPLIEQTNLQLDSNPENQELRSALGGYFHNRAMARSSLGDVNGALADLQQAIRLQELAMAAQPDNSAFSSFAGKHYSLIGSLYYGMGEQDRAVTAIEKAVQVVPHSSEYRRQAAVMRMERLEYDKAADLLRPFVADTSDVTLEYLLAVSLLRQNLHGGASDVISRMRSRHPREVTSLFLAGVMLMMEEDYSTASEVLQKALAIRQSEPAILYDIAICKMKSGQADEAEHFILRLQDVDPSLAAVLRQDMHNQTPDRDPLPVMFELYDL
jgi:tetratricopeptide (TPR) repeat protein